MTRKPVSRFIRDAATGRDLPPRAQPGYYPGQSAMAQKDYWDDATRKIVERRIETDKPIRFFTSAEAPVMQAMLDCVLPQDDRNDDHKIPVLALLDETMHARKFDGYIYEGTLEVDEMHRLAIHAIDGMARERHGCGFADLSPGDREAIMIGVRDGDPGPGWTCGDRVPAQFYWTVLINAAVAAYYAHPYAWDEIGYGGPAYPRGYMRLTEGLPEPWEKDERRYDWLAPADTQSDVYTDNTGYFAKAVKAKGGLT